MNKIYSRPRIKIPRIVIQGGNKLNSPKGKKTIKIFLVLVIAFSIVKLVLDAVYPIFDTLCESKAKSIATIISNEQATNVMKRYSYDDMFILEKDSNNNVTMVRSNVISIRISIHCNIYITTYYPTILNNKVFAHNFYCHITIYVIIVI